MDCLPRLIIIAGATGVGKTDVALRLAMECCGEILSADSMQVYRHMDIGTAKPDKEQQSRVIHHGIDIVDPGQSFNASLFAEYAEGIISMLHRKEVPIFVVGGAGLYIRALLGGLFDGPGADEDLRAFYKDEMRRHGKDHLYEILQNKDAKAASVIDPHDVSRIVRALEVMELTGVSIMDKQQGHGFQDRKYSYVKIGLKMERAQMFERIDQRAERMFADGFVDEVRCLQERGYAPDLKPMQSLGYKHVGAYLRGLCSLEEAVRLMKRDTRHYAKRQMTWFSADAEFSWFHPDDMEGIGKQIAAV